MSDKKNPEVWPTWHAQLQGTINQHASHLNGYQVACCVTQATDACWEMGLDKAYHNLVLAEGLSEENADAFHMAWLVIFALKLHEHPSKREGIVA